MAGLWRLDRTAELLMNFRTKIVAAHNIVRKCCCKFGSPVTLGPLPHVRSNHPCSILPRLVCDFQRKFEMKSIFVGNLSFNASEVSVRSLFEEYGAVDRVNLVTDRDTGQQRGFAFVEMPVDSEAQRAIDGLNGRELNGRALNVNEARPKGDRGSGGGGRGGGGFGGQRRGNRY